MELFVYGNVDEDGYFTQGKALNDITSVMWVERYRTPGEFTIKAPVSSGMRNILPRGSFISHLDTHEIMFVENHEIDEDVEDTEPEVIITGRSLDAWFEQRIVGGDMETYVFDDHRLYFGLSDYVLDFDTSWEQAKELIRYHINDNFNIPRDNIAGWVPIASQQHIGSSTTERRVVKKQKLLTALQELLAVDDYGIKVIRPNPGNTDPAKTEFHIHNGVDRTLSVSFSYALGDLVNPKYFWSDKGLKTDYLCTSTYFTLRSDDPTFEGIEKRVLEVDCTDIDSWLSDTEVSDGVIAQAVADAMDVRGKQALRQQLASSLLSTNIAPTTRYKYREHYDVGDIVSVVGNYDAFSVLRVTEYAEFQDENGESGYPTLSILNE